jgi:hypothetical protein
MGPLAVLAERASQAKTFGVTLGLSSLTALSVQLPAHSAIVIDTKGSDTIFGNGQSVETIEFFADGIGLTFANPLSTSVDSRSRTVPIGTPTLPGGGTCLGGSRKVNFVHVCGNDRESSSTPEVDSIQLIFSQDVFINSMQITARSQTYDNTNENIAVSLWNGSLGTIANFDYAVNIIEDVVVHDSFRTKEYNSVFGTFLALAGQPVTVTSSFTNNIDYWITSIEVRRVPGPLPVLGVASAFAWSRRLRRKTQSVVK